MERGESQAAHELLQELGRQIGRPLEDLQAAYSPLRLNLCFSTDTEIDSIPRELGELERTLPEVSQIVSYYLPCCRLIGVSVSLCMYTSLSPT